VGVSLVSIPRATSDTLYLANFAIAGFFSFTIMHCIALIYPFLPRSLTAARSGKQEVRKEEESLNEKAEDDLWARSLV
jgi:hypothetical protein